MEAHGMIMRNKWVHICELLKKKKKRNNGNQIMRLYKFRGRKHCAGGGVWAVSLV